MDKDEEIALLKNEILLLKEKLASYANPSRAKKFYEANKERIAAERSEKYYKKKELNKKEK